MSLVHRGRLWHGLPNFLHIACMPFSYLKREDWVPKFGAHITCLECITSSTKETEADDGWAKMEVQSVRP